MTRGIDLRIPMPGHSVGDAVRQNVEQDVNQLVQLISEHDAIFLLTDTRESRWLPTMLSAFYGKVCVSQNVVNSHLIMLFHDSWSSMRLWASTLTWSCDTDCGRPGYRIRRWKNRRRHCEGLYPVAVWAATFAMTLWLQET